jgi:hypothetical protein
VDTDIHGLRLPAAEQLEYRNTESVLGDVFYRHWSGNENNRTGHWARARGVEVHLVTCNL